MPFGSDLVRRRHGRDERAASLQDRERTLLNLSADEVDDGIDGTDLVFERLHLIDHFLCAVAVHISKITGASRGNHTQPCPPGKLDRIGADISGGAVDQNALATSKTRLFKQRLPGGDSHDRNGGGLDVAKPRRLLSDHTGGDSRKFGISADKARIGDAEDVVTRFKCRHPRADGLHDAREVRAESQRQRLRQGALARPDPGVPGSDAGGLDPDENLALARFEPVYVLQVITLGGPKR